MIQLVREFKWFFIAPIVVMALIASLIVGLVVGGQSVAGRLSVANAQLQQAHDDLNKIQNSLSVAESQLANVKDNGELEVFDSYPPANKTLSKDYIIYTALGFSMTKKVQKKTLWQKLLEFISKLW